MQLDLALVQRLRPDIDRRIRRTPIVRTEAVSGVAAFWKLESTQHTGSFKVRGPLGARALQCHARVWVTASAGNHGLGVAFAARGGPPPQVFVPRSSPAKKRDAIARLGATLHLCDTDSYDDTDVAARDWARQHDGEFVSAFDDEVIMAGNGGTLACEILEQLPDVTTIVVPIGGGGLAAGVGCVVRALRPRVQLVGVQSVHTSAMSESWKSGAALLRQESGPTLAEGLSGGVSARSYEYVRAWFDDVITVEESDIAAGIIWLYRTLGVRVEGSAAVTAAAMLRKRVQGSVVCCVLTGSNIDDEVFDGLLQAQGERGT